MEFDNLIAMEHGIALSLFHFTANNIKLIVVCSCYI